MGALLFSIPYILPKSKIKVHYPRQEVIGVKGTRVEGVGIQPDKEVFTAAEALEIAKSWITPTLF